MKVVIRALEITTIIVTILLMSFIGLAAYSVKDMQIGFGYSTLTAGANHDLTLSLPFFINNVGLTDLKNFNLTTTVSNMKGETITKDSTLVKIIQKGENATIQHNITLSLEKMTLAAQEYLFQDENFTVNVDTGMTLAEILPCIVSTNFNFTWGAPLHNLRLTQLKIESINVTHVLVEVPLTFENHAAFQLRGNLSAQAIGPTGTLAGKSSIPLELAPGSRFDESLKFVLPASFDPNSSFKGGQVDLYFSTNLFSFGPVVMPIG